MMWPFFDFLVARWVGIYVTPVFPKDARFDVVHAYLHTFLEKANNIVSKNVNCCLGRNAWKVGLLLCLFSQVSGVLCKNFHAFVYSLLPGDIQHSLDRVIAINENRPSEACSRATFITSRNLVYCLVCIVTRHGSHVFAYLYSPSGKVDILTKGLLWLFTAPPRLLRRLTMIIRENDFCPESCKSYIYSEYCYSEYCFSAMWNTLFCYRGTKWRNGSHWTLLMNAWCIPRLVSFNKLLSVHRNTTI